MSNNGRGIIQPNAMNIETTYAAGPLAQPTAVTIQASGGLKVLAMGGLTKVEALAGQIAICNALSAIECVDFAEAILAECERRRNPEPEPSA